MRDRERGAATLSEVVVVLSIATLLAVPLMTMLLTTTRAEERQTSRNEANRQLEWAFGLISDDIRSSTPSSRLQSGDHPADTLVLFVAGSGSPDRLVYWRLEGDGLERTALDPTTGRVITRSTVAADLLAAGATAPFSYFDASGSELDPRRTDPETIATCTTLIRATLAAEVGQRTVSSALSAAPRSRPPGGNGC